MEIVKVYSIHLTALYCVTCIHALDRPELSSRLKETMSGHASKLKAIKDYPTNILSRLDEQQ